MPRPTTARTRPQLIDLSDLETRVLGTALALHHAETLPQRIVRRRLLDQAVAAYDKALRSNLVKAAAQGAI